MATVTSFESQQFHTKSELRQFAELFAPLFQASSEEAKRQAVAALSQCLHVPPAVAFFIGNQPISVAAIFLTRSQAITDDTLITIARTQGAAHATAIARRENLSPSVIDALVSLRQASPARGAANGHPDSHADTSPEDASLQREEALRNDLRKLAKHFFPPARDRLGLRALTDVQEALLIRFARSREAGHFATALADALSASRWLTERIMLDISGRQLATTLISLGMANANTIFILNRFYPHLSGSEGGISRAEALIGRLDRAECERRVDAWRRADSYTYQAPQNAPDVSENPEPAPRQRAGRRG